MKKKGFTLVELLAVIVILGVIALITTSVILGAIEDSRKKSFEASVVGVLNSVDYYLLENEDKVPDDGCIEVDIKELPIKNKETLEGTIEICSDGTVSAKDITDGKYYASGTKDNLIVTDDTKELPGYVPNTPAITASDGKVSGQWHTSSYSLTITGEEGFEIYYGTTEKATTKGNKITTGVGIDSQGTQTYYAKVCNASGSCSEVTRYVARLETCEVGASITGNTTSASNYSAKDIVLTAVASDSCNSGVASYEWSKDGNIIGTGSTYTATETGDYGVKIIYNSGQISPTYLVKVYIDKTVPKAPTMTSSDGKSSNSWHGKTYKLSVSGSSSPSGITYYLDANSIPTTKQSSLSSGIGISSGGTRTYYARACNGAGTCSAVTKYIANFDTCDPSIELTFFNPGFTEVEAVSYYTHPVYVSAISGCSGGSYTWYVNDEQLTSTETDDVSELDDLLFEEGEQRIRVEVGNAGSSGEMESTKTTSIYIDFNNPTVSSTVSTTAGTATVVINASDIVGIDTSKYKVRYKLSSDSTWSDPISSTTNTKKITGLIPGTSYDFQGYACDHVDRCVWSSTVTKSTQSLALPTLNMSAGVINFDHNDIYNLNYNSSSIYSIQVYGDWEDVSNYQYIIDYEEYLTGQSSLSDGTYWIDFESLYNAVIDYGEIGNGPPIFFLEGGTTGESVKLCVKTSDSAKYCKTYTVETTTPTVTSYNAGELASSITVSATCTDDSGIDKYSFFISKDGGSTWTTPGWQSSNSYTFTGINTSSDEVSFKVTCSDKVGNMKTSNTFYPNVKEADTTAPTLEVAYVSQMSTTDSSKLGNLIVMSCNDDNGSLADEAYVYTECHGSTCTTERYDNSGYPWTIDLDDTTTTNYVKVKCQNAVGLYSDEITVYPEIPSGTIYKGYQLTSDSSYKTATFSVRSTISDVSYSSYDEAYTIIEDYKKVNSQVSDVYIYQLSDIRSMLDFSLTNNIDFHETVYEFDDSQSAFLNAIMGDRSTILNTSCSTTVTTAACYGKVLKMNTGNIKWVSNSYMDTILGIFTIKK